MFGLESLVSALQNTTILGDNCSGYACDYSSHYITTGSDGSGGNLVGDGVIYPAQEANTAHNMVLSDSNDCTYYSCNHSADYIGTGGNQLGDGVIYPAQEANTAHNMMLSDSGDCSYYSCDHSADYIGAGSDGTNNLTGDGVIYPKYAPFANAEHTTALYEEADHSGAYYCVEAEAKCSTTVVDPVLKPLPSLAEATPGHSGAYYCADPTAGCSTTVVDPVLKPLPEVAVPMAPVEPTTARALPGTFVLCAHACILGAAEATSALLADPLQEGALEKWSQNFARNSKMNADAVTPVGGFMLGRAL